MKGLGWDTYLVFEWQASSSTHADSIEALAARSLMVIGRDSMEAQYEIWVVDRIGSWSHFGMSTIFVQRRCLVYNSFLFSN